MGTDELGALAHAGQTKRDPVIHLVMVETNTIIPDGQVKLRRTPFQRDDNLRSQRMPVDIR